ncbi:reticulocyte binding protein homologue 4 [Plasmodium reichenowi]|uniref:Reticulocyte binding protein homologue 4 n=1 Tax=Plasmodium reichenowi TaxID=5854 RepID=A0A2P9D6E1_PLARE|nr:reticulocyte binding protein homologue 4 [Plasmodium reichenowi]
MNKNILWITFLYFLFFLLDMYQGNDATPGKEKKKDPEADSNNSQNQHDKKKTHHMNNNYDLNIKDKDEKKRKNDNLINNYNNSLLKLSYIKNQDNIYKNIQNGQKLKRDIILNSFVQINSSNILMDEIENYVKKYTESNRIMYIQFKYIYLQSLNITAYFVPPNSPFQSYYNKYLNKDINEICHSIQTLLNNVISSKIIFKMLETTKEQILLLWNNKKISEQNYNQENEEKCKRIDSENEKIEKYTNKFEHDIKPHIEDIEKKVNEYINNSDCHLTCSKYKTIIDNYINEVIITNINIYENKYNLPQERIIKNYNHNGINNEDNFIEYNILNADPDLRSNFITLLVLRKQLIYIEYIYFINKNIINKIQENFILNQNKYKHFINSNNAVNPAKEYEYIIKYYTTFKYLQLLNKSLYDSIYKHKINNYSNTIEDLINQLQHKINDQMIISFDKNKSSDIMLQCTNIKKFINDNKYLSIKPKVLEVEYLRNINKHINKNDFLNKFMQNETYKKNIDDKIKDMNNIYDNIYIILKQKFLNKLNEIMQNHKNKQETNLNTTTIQELLQLLKDIKEIQRNQIDAKMNTFNMYYNDIQQIKIKINQNEKEINKVLTQLYIPKNQQEYIQIYITELNDRIKETQTKINLFNKILELKEKEKENYITNKHTYQNLTHKTIQQILQQQYKNNTQEKNTLVQLLYNIDIKKYIHELILITQDIQTKMYTTNNIEHIKQMLINYIQKCKPIQNISEHNIYTLYQEIKTNLENIQQEIIQNIQQTTNRLKTNIKKIFDEINQKYDDLTKNVNQMNDTKIVLRQMENRLKGKYEEIKKENLQDRDIKYIGENNDGNNNNNDNIIINGNNHTGDYNYTLFHYADLWDNSQFTRTKENIQTNINNIKSLIRNLQNELNNYNTLKSNGSHFYDKIHTLEELKILTQEINDKNVMTKIYDIENTYQNDLHNIEEIIKNITSIYYKINILNILIISIKQTYNNNKSIESLKLKINNLTNSTQEYINQIKGIPTNLLPEHIKQKSLSELNIYMKQIYDKLNENVINNLYTKSKDSLQFYINEKNKNINNNNDHNVHNDVYNDIKENQIYKNNKLYECIQIKKDIDELYNIYDQLFKNISQNYNNHSLSFIHSLNNHMLSIFQVTKYGKHKNQQILSDIDNIIKQNEHKESYTNLDTSNIQLIKEQIKYFLQIFHILQENITTFENQYKDLIIKMNHKINNNLKDITHIAINDNYTLQEQNHIYNELQNKIKQIKNVNEVFTHNINYNQQILNYSQAQNNFFNIFMKFQSINNDINRKRYNVQKKITEIINSYDIINYNKNNIKDMYQQLKNIQQQLNTTETQLNHIKQNINHFKYFYKSNQTISIVKNIQNEKLKIQEFNKKIQHFKEQTQIMINKLIQPSNIHLHKMKLPITQQQANTHLHRNEHTKNDTKSYNFNDEENAMGYGTTNERKNSGTNDMINSTIGDKTNVLTNDDQERGKRDTSRNNNIHTNEKNINNEHTNEQYPHKEHPNNYHQKNDEKISLQHKTINTSQRTIDDSNMDRNNRYNTSSQQKNNLHTNNNSNSRYNNNHDKQNEYKYNQGKSSGKDNSYWRIFYAGGITAVLLLCSSTAFSFIKNSNEPHHIFNIFQKEFSEADNAHSQEKEEYLPVYFDEVEDENEDFNDI